MYFWRALEWTPWRSTRNFLGVDNGRARSGPAYTHRTVDWAARARPVPLHWQRSRRCVLPGGLPCAFSTADLSGQQWKWNVKWQFVLSFLFTKQKVPQLSERFDCLLSSVKPGTLTQIKSWNGGGGLIWPRNPERSWRIWPLYWGVALARCPCIYLGNQTRKSFSPNSVFGMETSTGIKEVGGIAPIYKGVSCCFGKTDQFQVHW